MFARSWPYNSELTNNTSTRVPSKRDATVLASGMATSQCCDCLQSILYRRLNAISPHLRHQRRPEIVPSRYSLSDFREAIRQGKLITHRESKSCFPVLDQIGRAARGIRDRKSVV